ncbi:MAG: hypothetical protein ACYCOU_06515 [Sulfobacillus sp.]
MTLPLIKTAAADLFSNFVGHKADESMRKIRSHRHLQEFMERLDLEPRLALAASLKKYIAGEAPSKITVPPEFCRAESGTPVPVPVPVPVPLQLAAEQTSECVSAIELLLEQIQSEAHKHAQKYFSSYRVPGYLSKLKRLELQSQLLDRRLQLLLQLIAATKRAE